MSREVELEKVVLALSDALRELIVEPYGCSLCHSGKVINPAKGHQSDCPFELAHTALENADRLLSISSPPEENAFV